MSDADVFRAYADVYDALYADKDYEGEVRFVTDVFSEYGVKAGASVLDLGCGTGGHAIPLARRGYRMTGVDLSPEMVTQAVAKAEHALVSAEFVVGDVRDVRLGRRFDTVVSMFAVLSYQLTDADLEATFQTVAEHLEPGGLFVFDVWFGPAVLSQRPEPRTKTVITREGDTITRAATPELDVVEQTVRVDYEISRSRAGAVVETTRESHTVRFFFVREVRHLLASAGLELLALGPFMDLTRRPTVDDWYLSVVARAR
ncbi:MAG TPA: class I SAM-dependent methyltransferase [Coriobacteriia bacterium]|nr:class I SAM-dependent methyltransferase [Coriobacteriia bacterium]